MSQQKNEFLFDYKSIRNQHLMLIFSILQKKTLSCNELAKESNLSIVSVYKVLENLLSRNIIVSKTEKLPNLPGRKPTIYTLNENFGYFLVFDFTLPILKVGVYNILQKSVIYKQYEHRGIISKDYLISLILDVKKSINERQISGKIQGIAVSVSGRVDNKTGFFTASASFENAQSINLKNILSEYFDCPIYVKNNISLALINFVENFNQYKIKNAIYFYINNGNVGSSIFLKYKNYNGDNNYAGEISSTLSFDKQPLHSIFFAPYEKYPNLNPATDVMPLYDDGDAIAEELVNDSLDSLSIFLHNTLLILDCKTVIVDCFFCSTSTKAQEVLIEKINALCDNSIPIPQMLFASSNESTFLNGGLNYIISKVVSDN